MTLSDSDVSSTDTQLDTLVVTDVEHVNEVVDPRLTISTRPSVHALDEEFNIPHHIANALHHTHDDKRSEKLRHEHGHHHGHGHGHSKERDTETGECVREASPELDEGILYIDWDKGDPRNPENFSYARKWVITITASALTGLSASAASTYAMGYPSMMRDLDCTLYEATIGLSLYAIGFGIVPLVTAPLSEEFGRHPLYVASTFLFLCMHLGIALAKNIQTVLILRFIAGAAGSTGATMVGGTVADIWAPSERGLPMALFGFAAVGGTGLGPVMAGWIEMSRHLGWRWIQWIHFIATGVYLLVMIVALTETRSSVLLTRLAQKLRKQTGDLRYRSRIEDERGSLKTLMLISCTRPIHLLFTEPVVASFSLWIGFAWGVFYSLIESISPAFRQLHHFNDGQAGTVFVTILIGSLLGAATNFYQERTYKKNFKEKGQEARLYSACVAGVLFPVGMFIYAWTSFEHVHWIGMAIGVVVFIWAVFVMYIAVFTYLADCYGPFASSALAGQSLCRNLSAFIFPLFTTQMFNNLTFKWSSTLFGCIAVLMTPIPFVLFKWGPMIRARSKFASQVPAFGS